MLEINDMKLYDVTELAERLKLHEKTVRSMLRAGRLKGRKLGKKWYTTEQSLKDYFHASEDHSQVGMYANGIK